MAGSDRLETGAATHIDCVFLLLLPRVNMGSLCHKRRRPSVNTCAIFHEDSS